MFELGHTQYAMAMKWVAALKPLAARLACCSSPFIADGVSSRPDVVSSDMEDRMAAAKRAHEILGLHRVEYLGLPDNRMDSLPLLDVVQALEVVIQSILPQIVYTHHFGDLNVDHRITHQAVMTACRPLPNSPIREIYAFEVLSSTEWSVPTQASFVPNMFVDISGFLDVKRKALQAYQLEMHPVPHSRNLEHVENLVRHRGYSVGVEAAEAFMMIRSIK